jgi:hypothetical protein
MGLDRYAQEDREALCQHNEERYDWLEHLGAQDRSVSIPWYQRVADLRVSTTDPDASLMLTKGVFLPKCSSSRRFPLLHSGKKHGEKCRDPIWICVLSKEPNRLLHDFSP